jgi:hypothetical protein
MTNYNLATSTIGSEHFDGTLCEQRISGYDSEGRIARTYGLKRDGKPLGDGQYIYGYDDGGRLSKVWSFNKFADHDLANAVTT